MTHATCCPGLWWPSPGPGALRSDAVIIMLGDEEMTVADGEGRRRNSHDAAAGYQPRAGLGRNTVELEVAAAAAELALARWLGVPWTGIGGEPRPGDVGADEVRHTLRPAGSLILHPGERGRQVLVTGTPPVLVLRGWLESADGQLDEWWRDDVPHPAYFVPQDALHDLRQLR